ncbi:helix-turn-helix domain-containing protein [Candidatus Woesebacteria bacterium]|nr:helix-turn-helix domain-containing protein [Candidatus Woesebacteria bacterium]
MQKHQPLPQKEILKRLSPFFKELSIGKSGSIVGTYKSIKSGLLQYVLGNRSEFTDYLPKDAVIVFFEPTLLISANPYYWLHQLSIAISQTDPNYKHTVTEDTAVLLGALQQYITRLSDTGKRLVIIFYKIERLKDIHPTAAESLVTLYRTRKIVTLPACSFWFLLDDINPMEMKTSAFLEKLTYPLCESILYFPDLTPSETEYWIDIFADRYNMTLDVKTRKKIYTYCGGNYSLIYDAFLILQKDGFTENWLKVLENNPIITQYLEEYRKTFSLENQRLIIKYAKGQIGRDAIPIINDLQIHSKLFFDYCANLADDVIAKSGISFFTGRELQLYEYLKSKKNTLVPKEDVQKLIWDDNYDSFSLWAQDKMISRLRKKLKIANYGESLIVVKNRGIMLWDENL